MKRDYSKTDFTIEDCDVEGFVKHFNLEEEAVECFGENWTPDGDDEMINLLLEHIGQDLFVTIVDVEEGIIDVIFDEDKKELRDTKRTLKLALLQLQEYSENDLIIIEGEEAVSISKTLEKLS
jgi:putative sterol carrier protein